MNQLRLYSRTRFCSHGVEVEIATWNNIYRKVVAGTEYPRKLVPIDLLVWSTFCTACEHDLLEYYHSHTIRFRKVCTTPNEHELQVNNDRISTLLSLIASKQAELRTLYDQLEQVTQRVRTIGPKITYVRTNEAPKHEPKLTHMLIELRNELAILQSQVKEERNVDTESTNERVAVANERRSFPHNTEDRTTESNTLCASPTNQGNEH